MEQTNGRTTHFIMKCQLKKSNYIGTGLLEGRLDDRKRSLGIKRL